MTENEQITPLQLTFLWVWCIVATGILYFPTTISRYVVEDAWTVAVPFFLVFGATIAWLHGVLGTKFSRMTLIGICETIYGKIIGKFLGLILVLWFLFVTALTLRLVGEFIVLAIMPETPLIAVNLLFMALVAYSVRHGIEVIARTGEILSPVSYVAIAVVVVLVAKEARFENLLPFMAKGWGPPIRASLTPVSFAATTLGALMFTPSLNRPRLLKLSLVLSVVVVSTVGLMIESMSTMVFGAARREIMFLHFDLIRLIKLLKMHFGLQSIFMTVIICGSFLQVSLFYHLTAVGLRQWLGLKYHRPLITPLGVVIIALSVLLFENILEIVDFMDKFLPAASLTLQVGILCLLLLGARVRRL
jgi:spore germination protein KB